MGEETRLYFFIFFRGESPFRLPYQDDFRNIITELLPERCRIGQGNCQEPKPPDARGPRYPGLPTRRTGMESQWYGLHRRAYKSQIAVDAENSSPFL